MKVFAHGRGRQLGQQPLRAIDVRTTGLQQREGRTEKRRRCEEDATNRQVQGTAWENVEKKDGESELEAGRGAEWRGLLC